jgi:hypothetical protein
VVVVVVIAADLGREEADAQVARRGVDEGALSTRLVVVVGG